MFSDTTLTDRQTELLTAIRSTGNWINRAALAAATGKNRLSPHDLTLLERLAAANLIRVREGESRSLRGTETQYRATVL